MTRCLATVSSGTQSTQDPEWRAMAFQARSTSAPLLTSKRGRFVWVQFGYDYDVYYYRLDLSTLIFCYYVVSLVSFLMIDRLRLSGEL